MTGIRSATASFTPPLRAYVQFVTPSCGPKFKPAPELPDATLVCRPLAALSMLACASSLVLPSSALAQDAAAEVPDIAVSEPQTVTSGPSYGIARTSDTPELWATVNICDTDKNPDSMGIRAGMPGNGTDQRMWMRFTAEYWSRARQAWTAVSGTGVSPWVYAGSAQLERRQAGWTFAFSEPPEGVTFTMRAQVEFEWRAKGVPASKRQKLRRRGAARRVLRSEMRLTQTGVRGVHGGDPAGTSKAMCLIY